MSATDPGKVGRIESRAPESVPKLPVIIRSKHCCLVAKCTTTSGYAADRRIRPTFRNVPSTRAGRRSASEKYEAKGRQAGSIATYQKQSAVLLLKALSYEDETHRDAPALDRQQAGVV
jgi:hypothetical protein